MIASNLRDQRPAGCIDRSGQAGVVRASAQVGEIAKTDGACSSRCA